jgi:hypothetical protein
MTELNQLFQKKYEEFCTDLEGACPELSAQIAAARGLSQEDRKVQFAAHVKASPQRDGSKCPGTVLPGVVIPETLWSELSSSSQKAIQEYLTLLTMCSLYTDASFADLSGNMEWMNDFLKHWKSKLESTDFKNLTERFSEFLKSAGGAASSAASGGSMPSLPERFLKGHIARLAEELVHEFRPEDFGLTAEQLQECERDPARAIEVLVTAYTSNPQVLQTAMKRIASRMQQKFQRGEIRPEDLRQEAEDILKECTENPALQGMMESFRDAFGAFADPDTARTQGRDGDARLQLVRERLRKKMEKKKGGKK